MNVEVSVVNFLTTGKVILMWGWGCRFLKPSSNLDPKNSNIRESQISFDIFDFFLIFSE